MAVPVLGRSRVLLNHSPLSSITAARRTRQFRCPCSWTRAMSGDAGDGGEVGAGAANSKRVMKRKRDAQCPDVEDLAKKWSEGDIGRVSTLTCLSRSSDCFTNVAFTCAAPPWLCRNARRQLLAWYDRGHRILPWRRNAHSQRGALASPEHEAFELQGPVHHSAFLPFHADDAGGGAPADLDDSTFAYRVSPLARRTACCGRPTARSSLRPALALMPAGLGLRGHAAADAGAGGHILFPEVGAEVARRPSVGRCDARRGQRGQSAVPGSQSQLY